MNRMTIAILATAIATTSFSTSWETLGLLPQFKADQELTASRWLWKNLPAWIHTQGYRGYDVSLFRYTFEADSPIVKGALQYTADDCSTVHLNGQMIHPNNFAKLVKPGRNVFAVVVTNLLSAGGLLVFGDFTLASGKKLSIRSNREFKVLDGTNPPEGWALPDFDDSGWANAYEQGDARMEPFSKYHDYTKQFATDEERARIKQLTSGVEEPKILPSIAAEPEMNAKVVYEGVRPLIDLNGKRFEPDLCLCGANTPHEMSYIVKSHDLGIRLHQVGIRHTIMEKSAGVYDFSSLDFQIRRILKYAPEAYFMLCFRLDLPKWCAEHRDACIGYADGEIDTTPGDERLTRQLRPSVASAEYRAECKRLFDALGAYVNAQPWRKRVFALRPCWGIYTEWHCYGMYHYPDVGPAMTAAFRKWDNGRYANETPPTVAERSHKTYLLDPVSQRKVIDFYDCMANQISDFLLTCARDVKRVFPGRLAGFYYGYLFAIHPPEGANVMLEKVVSSPDVDFLSNPSMYSAASRRAGGSYYHRTIPDTFHRYGKLVFIEDDMRFHHVRDWTPRERAICTETPRESRMTMRRNYFNKLFDGCGLQMCDPIPGRGVRPFAYDAPAVSLAIHESKAIVAKAGERSALSGNDTVIVLSELERLRRDPNTNRLIYNTYCTPEWIFRTGCTFDTQTLAGFLASKRDYKHVVMLNAFSLSDSERAALKAKLRHPGISTLWLIAPGSVTPTGFSDAAMTDLTGLPLKGAGANPKVKGVGDGLEQFPLGGCRKQLADGSTAAFIPVAPATIAEWRQVLLQLGTAPIAEPENYVRRHGSLVLFHTANAGEHKLRVPRDLAGQVATDLVTGERYEGNEFSLVTDGCDTRLLRFDK